MYKSEWKKSYHGSKSERNVSCLIISSKVIIFPAIRNSWYCRDKHVKIRSIQSTCFPWSTFQLQKNRNLSIQIKMPRPLVFFLNGTEVSWNSVNLMNSGNLINHWSMNGAKFNDPVSYMSLAGAVVASWSFTQEVAGSSHFVDNYFCHWIQWKHLGNSPLGRFLLTFDFMEKNGNKGLCREDQK